MIEMKSMIFTVTKLTDNKKVIEKSKEKINYVSMIFTIISRLFKVNKPQKKQFGKVNQNFNDVQLLENKNSNKMVRFLALVMRVFRLYQKLRFQSIFRPLKKLTDQQMNLIGDVTYIRENNEMVSSKINFFNNKLLRRTMRSMKRSSQKYLCSWIHPLCELYLILL